MTTIVILGVVVGLLYGYQNQGWKLFYQGYSRNVSHLKAKLALRVLTEDLREANKSRIDIGRGVSYGIPFPDDAYFNSPYIYFTKPVIHDRTKQVISYNYILYYYGNPVMNSKYESLNTQKRESDFLILKNIKFSNQSKTYTEDNEKEWPFLPPILEIYMSSLPEDDSYISFLDSEIDSINNDNLGSEVQNESETENTQPQPNAEGEFIDHFSRLKKDSKNLAVSGNFSKQDLTDPFTKEEVNFNFGEEYKSAKPISIKVTIKENPLFFSSKDAITEFKTLISPRN